MSDSERKGWCPSDANCTMPARHYGVHTYADSVAIIEAAAQAQRPDEGLPVAINAEHIDCGTRLAVRLYCPFHGEVPRNEARALTANEGESDAG